MPTHADAWLLYPGTPAERGRLAVLRRETLDLPDPGPRQVIAAPLYGAWGANMTHALERKPVDLCGQRGEPKVVLGNAAVVRVVACGREVTTVEPGQRCMLFATSVGDRYGYTEKALAYDAPGSMGCLATRMLVGEHELLPLPDGTRYRDTQWAAFSGSFITAWSNWRLAWGVLRLQLTPDELPHPHAWGWGGGTTLAELDLARRHGCRAAQMSSDDARMEQIRRCGVTPIDRRPFAALQYDDRRFATDPGWRRAYADAEATFLREVRERTDGEGVHVFCDYIGTPVYRATLKALARQGIITTAGWREGMVMSHLRAAECISRHQHIHTHYARRCEGVDARDYGEREGWMPEMDARIYTFDEVQELAEDVAAGRAGFYTAFSIDP